MGKNSEDTPIWIYDDNYWTMSKYEDSGEHFWVINNNGTLNNDTSCYKVRPVVELYKSALQN